MRVSKLKKKKSIRKKRKWGYTGQKVEKDRKNRFWEREKIDSLTLGHNKIFLI